MNNWKYLPLVAVMTFTLVAAPARSQIQRMVDQLSLSADHKAKIDPIPRDRCQDQAHPHGRAVEEAGATSRGKETGGQEKEVAGYNRPRTTVIE